MKIFKHMLVENPKVLVEFVHEGLNEHHVQMIEWMIQPEKLPDQERNRAFLYEVYIHFKLLNGSIQDTQCHNTRYTHSDTHQNLKLLTKCFADCLQQNQWSRCE